MATSTGTMYRVQQVATGVAGSPYYLTGYFNASLSTGQTAADAWRAMIGSAVATFVAPYAYLAITSVDLVSPVTGDIIGQEAVTVPQVTFTDASDPLPPATSLLLRWRTGQYLNGKEIRGRTNIARLSEVNNTGGVVVAGTITTWQARINTLVAGGTFQHVVWSPKNGCWAATTSGSPWNQWAVLRSRRD